PRSPWSEVRAVKLRRARSPSAPTKSAATASWSCQRFDVQPRAREVTVDGHDRDLDPVNLQKSWDRPERSGQFSTLSTQLRQDGTHPKCLRQYSATAASSSHWNLRPRFHGGTSLAVSSHLRRT